MSNILDPSMFEAPTQEALDLMFENSTIETQEDFTPTLPFLMVSRDEFLRVLKIVNSLPANSSINFSLSTSPGGDFLHVFASNNDTTIFVNLRVLNPNPYKIPNQIHLNVSTLLPFVQSYNRFCLAFGENGEVFFSNSYVTTKLETFAGDSILPPQNLSSDFKEFPLLTPILKTYQQGFDLALRPSDNLMVIYPSQAYAHFTLFSIESSIPSSLGPSSNVVLRKIDIPLLRQISDYGLTWDPTEDCLYFRFDLGVIRIPRVVFNQSQFLAPKIDFGEEEAFLSMDARSLRLASALALNLSYKSVEFVNSETDKQVFMLVGNSRFLVGMGNISTTVQVPLDIFGKLIAAIDPKTVEVFITITTGGIRITADKTTTFLLSRTSLPSSVSSDSSVKMSSDFIPKAATSSNINLQDLFEGPK